MYQCLKCYLINDNMLFCDDCFIIEKKILHYNNNKKNKK